MSSDSNDKKKFEQTDESENHPSSLSLLSESSSLRGEAVGVTEDELRDLDAFCASFDFDDLSYDNWVSCVHDLDLKIEKQVKLDDIVKQEYYTLQYTTCFEKAGKKKKVKQEIKIATEKISKKIDSRTEFVFKGKGDQSAEACGDVYLTVIVCRER